MPRLRVIVLTQEPNNSNNYNVAFWADVPAARQSYYANASATSAWSGAQQADITALQSGSMSEMVASVTLPAGTSLAQLEAYLQQDWQKYQNSITNNNPWVHYGSTWDGTTWTIATGA